MGGGKKRDNIYFETKMSDTVFHIPCLKKEVEVKKKKIYSYIAFVFNLTSWFKI